MTKYIVVLGTLLSGLGKGLITSSIARILKWYNVNVMPFKFDGYLNYDCGTMNPYRHGEVFVLDDGSEVDMDFGNYERFLNINMNKDFSLTGGKLFKDIIEKERRGEFLGEDVQVIPHLVNEILAKIKNISNKYNLDVLVIEVGGTVGDLENSYFIEAMRHLALEEKVIFFVVTYLPKLRVVGEQKTKPAQLAIKALMQMGIRPDFIVTRSEEEIEPNIKKKLALFSNVKDDHIIDDHDLDTIYAIPLHFMEQGLDNLLLNELDIKGEINNEELKKWQERVDRLRNAKKRVSIAIVGKYTKLHDSYASLIEAIHHAEAELGIIVDIKWVESEELEINNDRVKELLNGIHGIIVPGGFGKRGIEGMINAIEFARTNKIPYLGLCLGLQLMSIEYARNVCNLEGANSTEFDPNTKYKVVDLLPEQLNVIYKGGTMRLGLWDSKLKINTKAYESYKKEIIQERHRHRYEVNNEYREILENNGLIISGTTLDNKLVEFIEWSNSFGIATQAHPELKSRFLEPSPLFVSFIKEAAKQASIL